MLDFENPGHREALKRFGLSLPDNTGVSPDHLAKQVLLNKEQMREILYILEQEMSHYENFFQNLSPSLEILWQSIQAIDREYGDTLEELQKYIDDFTSLVSRIKQIAEWFALLTEAINIISANTDQITSESKQHLENMLDSRNAILKYMEGNEKKETPQDQIKKIQRAIERKRKTFGNAST